MPRLIQLTVLSAVTIATLAVSAETRADTTISGTIANATNAVVHVSGPSPKAVPIGSDGRYSVATSGSSYYTIAPRDTNFVFTPAALFKETGDSSVAGVDFAGTATTSPTYKIAGTISGEFEPGAMITLNGVNVGSVGADGGGTYSISGLTAGTYTVSASRAGYAFSRSRVVTLTDADSVDNGFTSTRTPGSNAITLTAVSHLPQATVGVAYSISMLKSIAGGTGAYHYQSGPYSSGTPPLGMVVNANGVLTGTPRKAGTYSFKLCAADGYGDVSETCGASTITVGTKDISSTPAAPSVATRTSTTASASWVYYNGVFDWPGDWSFSATPDYTDTSGAPLSGPHDIKITSGAWGGWQPFAPNLDFADSRYASLTFALKPTRADQTWQVYFVKAGDIPAGNAVDVSQYGPKPVAGQWATYTVPLSALGVAGSAVYKFVIQDQTGAADNTWYIDNIGFMQGAQPNPITPPTPIVPPTPKPTPTPIPTPTPTPTPPPTPAPTAGTSWVYYDGSFDWPGDYSFAATPDYSDTSGAPLSGGHDIKITSSAWGGWLPYALNWDFNAAPYTNLTFSLRPTRTDQTWQVYFVKVGDIPVGIAVDVSQYGPTPVAGKWATYTVPLSVLGVAGTSIYKFAIQDQTGANDNTWYVDNVGFSK